MTNKVLKISLVLPVYNEQVILQEVLAKYISDFKAAEVDYEVIAVDDGCSDGSVDILMNAAKLNRRLKIISLDARYGKQAAITAGMNAADPLADAVIIADVDILNPVGILGKIIEQFKEGKPIVYAKREKLGFDAMKDGISDTCVKLGARIFGIEGRYTGKTNIALYARDVADVIVSLPNKNKFMRTMDTWTGWEIEYLHYMSGYNKIEHKQKLRESAERMKRAGREPVYRDKARDHTASKVYAMACAIMAVATLAVAVYMAASTALAFHFHLMAWMIFIILVLIAVMFWARAIIIKRIGIIHTNSTQKIYGIKKTIN